MYCPGKAAALSFPSFWAPHCPVSLSMLVGELLTGFLNLAGSSPSVFDVASFTPVTPRAGKRRTQAQGQACPRSSPQCHTHRGRGRHGGFRRARWGRGGARATPATCTCGPRKHSPDHSHCLLTLGKTNMVSRLTSKGILAVGSRGQP